MITKAVVYFVLFGIALVVLLGIIIAYYYSKKRHQKVELPKYKMLEGED